jgi:hypothetical protein
LLKPFCVQKFILDEIRGPHEGLTFFERACHFPELSAKGLKAGSRKTIMYESNIAMITASASVLIV